MSDFARMLGRVLVAKRRFGGQYLFIIADGSNFRVRAPGMQADWPVNFSKAPTRGDARGLA